MTGGHFSEQVQELKQAIAEAIAEAIARFFEEKGIPFDGQRFCEATSIDHDQLCMEAHFYGAEIFPVTPAQPTDA